VETVQQMVRRGRYDPEIAPVLDVGDAAGEAVVKRRTDLGSFESLNQLKKTPGLDRAPSWRLARIASLF
jgi:DNA uptake protein ComE-like DNA-binding protein